MANANIINRKGVPVTLDDGKEYRLLYTMESFIKIEEEYGSVEEGMKALSTDKMKPLADFIYYGLVSTAPELKREDIPRLISMETMPAVSTAMNLALSQDNAEAQEEQGDNTQTKSVPNS